MEIGSYVLLTGIGLAAAAGLNAYVPLLVAGILAHLGAISLVSPYDLLASWPALAILGGLLAIEVVADKVPALDSANDLVQTFVRPTSGALLFLGAVAPDSQWSQALALIAGIATAGTVHAAKASVRPVANVGTAGVAAPVLSTVEDAVSIALSLAAILVPVLVVLILVLMAWAAWRLARRLRRAAA